MCILYWHVAPIPPNETLIVQHTCVSHIDEVHQTHSCMGACICLLTLCSFPMTTLSLTAPQAHLCYLSLDTTQAKQLQLFHSNYWPAEQYCDLHHVYLCHSFELVAAAGSQQFAVHTSCIHKALDRTCSSLSRGNEKGNLLSLNCMESYAFKLDSSSIINQLTAEIWYVKY